MIAMTRYTPQGDYPAQAKRCADSCARFGLPCDSRAVALEGDWAHTIKRKPLWIMQALFAYRQAVLWLDADCELVRLPYLLLGSHVDFAAYNWSADAANPNAYPYDPKRLIVSGGVMLWGYTAPALELLTRWHTACVDSGTEQLDDPLLDEVYNESRPPVTTLWLPSSYNRMQALFPAVTPVIEHHYTNGKHGNAQGETKAD